MPLESDPTPLPHPPNEEHYSAALEVARWLVDRTRDAGIIEGGLVQVEIVVGNPTVKEYKVTIAPHPDEGRCRGRRSYESATSFARASSGATERVSFIALKPPSSATVTSAATPASPRSERNLLRVRIPRRRSAQPARPTGPKAIVTVSSRSPRLDPNRSLGGAVTGTAPPRAALKPQTAQAGDCCGHRDRPDAVDHVGIRRVEVVQRLEPDLRLAREVELPGNGQEPLLEEAVKGLLGLPHVAHLETVLAERREVQNTAGSRRHVELEPRHDRVVLPGCDPGPVHEHRDSHPQFLLFHPPALGRVRASVTPYG